MYVRILMMLSLQMGMVFFAFTNTPRKILAFDLLKALSANLHSLRSESVLRDRCNKEPGCLKSR